MPVAVPCQGDSERNSERLRAEARAHTSSFQIEFHADVQDRRMVVRGEVASLRMDVEALGERLCLIGGAIEGLFAARDHRNDAAWPT